MKNAIEYFYRLVVDDIKYENGYYLFDKYALVATKGKRIDVLLDNNYDVIPDINGNLYVVIDNEEYILLDVSEVKSFALENLFSSVQVGHDVLPIDEIWMKKIDYYEEHERLIKDDKLRSLFHYYIGLGENAISFYKMFKGIYPIYYMHSRIKCNFDFFNPINMVIDYRTRDLAEYIKYEFFYGKLDIEKIFLLMEESNFTEFDFTMLYARLLFPTYFFDFLDGYLEGEDVDIWEFDKIMDYELFLNNFYDRISEKSFLPKIIWLNK